MRPNVQLTRNPLNHEGLIEAFGTLPVPDTHLDYRTQAFYPNADRQLTRYLLVVAALVGFGLAVALHATHGFFANQLTLVLAVTYGLGAFIVAYLKRDELLKQVFWLVLGPLLWVLLVVVGHTTPERTYLVLYPVTILLAVLLAESILVHYASWMCANPRISPEVRRRWNDAWLRNRYRTLTKEFQRPRPAASRDHLLARELPERHRYSRGLYPIVIAYAVGLFIVHATPMPLFAGMFAVLGSTAALIMYACWNCHDYGARRGLSLRDFFSVFWTAVVSWFTYNRQENVAPGVLQSPSGTSLRRGALALVSFAMVSLVVINIASFFPVAMAVTGPRPWAEASSEPWPWETLFKRPARSKQAPKLSRAELRQRVTQNLTPERELYLQRLPENLRDDYLDGVAATLPKEVLYPELARSDEPPLRAIPTTAWVGPLFRGVLSLEPLFIWSFLASFLFCVTVPVVAFLAVLFAVTGRVLMHHYLTLEAEGAPYQTERGTLWNARVRRLQQSPNPTERKHLWLGTCPESDFPVLLSRGILDEHGHIMGDSGSGKTALALAPLLEQLSSFDDTSIVVIDLKGDMALFEAARIGAELSGKRFKWFTNELGLSTHVFNPFLQPTMAHLSGYQQAEILLQSLGLEHGEAYGRSYYSRVNRDVLAKLLSDFPEIRSFAEMPEFVKNLKLSKKLTEDAGELFAVISSLARFEAINITPKSPVPAPAVANAIDMGAVLTEAQVIYFYLPAAIETASVREVGKLALYSLLASAARHRGGDEKRKQVYLVIDEFQQIVAHNLEIILRQARSMGIGAILANQTLSDLETADVDLVPTVQANTRFRQLFSLSSLVQQNASIEASGETIYELGRWVVSDRNFTRGQTRAAVLDTRDSTIAVSENIGPRLRRNDVIEISDRERSNFVHVTRGKEYTQYGGYIFPVDSDYHITQAEYERRQNAPWPAATPGTIVPPLGARPERPQPAEDPVITAPEASEGGEPPGDDALSQTLEERLRNME